MGPDGQNKSNGVSIGVSFTEHTPVGGMEQRLREELRMILNVLGRCSFLGFHSFQALGKDFITFGRERRDHKAAKPS